MRDGGEALSSARYWGTYEQATAVFDQGKFPEAERMHVACRSEADRTAKPFNSCLATR